MRRFKDDFRFISSKQPLNKDRGYYLNDRIVGNEIEISFDYLKFVSALYKIMSIFAIICGIATFIDCLCGIDNTNTFFYNFICVVIFPIIFLYIGILSMHKDNLCKNKLKKYENNHWNFVLTEVKSIRKGFSNSVVYFEGFENSVVLKNKYAKYLKENQKVYLITIEKDCSDILVIYDWNGETYSDRGFTVNNIELVGSVV